MSPQRKPASRATTSLRPIRTYYHEAAAVPFPNRFDSPTSIGRAKTPLGALRAALRHVAWGQASTVFIDNEAGETLIYIEVLLRQVVISFPISSAVATLNRTY